MNVGIDCHNLEIERTGIARYLMNLLKYWAKRKNIRFVLYFKEKIPKDVPKSKNFVRKILKAPLGIQSNALFEHLLLPKAVKKDKLDVFFSPSYLLPIDSFRKIKTAVAIHDISYEAHSEWFSWQNRILLRWISKKAAKKTDVIFVPSQFTKNEILKYYQVRPEKIFVVPLAADEKFKKLKNIGDRISYIKKKYGLRDKFILFVGAIFNRRFVPETIRAFAKITKKLPAYQFLIAGPNYTHPFIDIDSLIKKTSAVLHIKYVKDDDLVLLYNAADLFIWLSSYEGFGLPPLEAMTCAMPVVTTKFASLPEVTENCSLIVKNPENIDEISHVIYKGLTDEKLKRKLVKGGMKQVRKFSWEKTAQETLKILLNYEQK